MDGCLKCKSSWLGKPIPEEHREEYYGGKTHFKREIGIDGGYMGIYDGIVALMCPDCKEYFPCSNSSWALEMFDKFMNPEKRDEDFDPFKF